MNALITTYVGFYGHLTLPLSLETLERVLLPFPSQKVRDQKPLVVQWVDPILPRPSWLPTPDGSTLLVAGMLMAPTLPERLAPLMCHALSRGAVASLPAGDYCACLIRGDQVIFFQTATSNDTIFYRRSGDQITWSTNPSDIADALDEAALERCCTGDDPLVYQDMIPLKGGSLVAISKGRTETVTLEADAPARLPHTLSLREAAIMTRTALLEATSPLCVCSRVGVLLSGGIDSSALAAALVEQDVDVAAYHFAFPGSAADESPYAAAVCEGLHIPFVQVQVNPGNADYLNRSWRFPHPYSHAGYAWFVQVADRVAHDGIRFLVTGRGGDPAFSPADSYGLSAILRSPLPPREKWAMMSGAFSTTWRAPDLIKSLSPSSSLISHRSLKVARSSEEANEPDVPFLRHKRVRETEASVFSPQDLVLEQTVWRPRGIHVVHPYYAPPITRLTRSLPAPYLLLPYQGMKVVKPTLRLAFADRLPPLVVRHRWGSWLDEPGQRYCLEQAPIIAQLIGRQDSEVVKRGFVIREALQELLCDSRAIRRHYMSLLATAMTELFLRQWEATSQERGTILGLH